MQFDKTIIAIKKLKIKPKKIWKVIFYSDHLWSAVKQVKLYYFENRKTF
jgi:hypothetical protein